MHRQARIFLELSLPRLPAREWRRLLSGHLCAAIGCYGDGKPKYYRVIAESGRWVDRGICEACGSNLFILAELVPELQGLWAGSLDDPSQFKPQIHVWTRSSPWWSTLDPALKKLDVAPNEAQFGELLAEAASLVPAE